MSFAPPKIVAGIPRSGLPHGFFSYLSFRSDNDPHWQNGVQWETIGGDAASGIGNIQCDTEEIVGLPKSFAGGPDLGEAEGFVVYGSYVCSPTGHPVSFAKSQAQLRLALREEARVERAIWSGDLSTAALASTDALTLTSSAVDIVRAVALLEAHLALTYGSLGVIHMTREAATLALASNAIEVKGGTLQTLLGTPVVAGTGYLGTGPTGAAPDAGETWIYASPPLMGYRSEIFTSSNREGDLLDRRTNDLYAIAERNYVIGFDPGPIGAAQVALD